MPEVALGGEHHGRAGSSAAATTSASRTEPPGWITTATPASARTSSPSGNGKKASLAATAAFARLPALRTAISAASTLLCWPAPIPTAWPEATMTMALEVVRAHTRQASSTSRHCSAVGTAFVATCQSERVVMERSASCTR